MGEHVVVEVGRLASSMKDKLKDFDSKALPWAQGPTIFRVIPSVRQQDASAYEPKIVSIGPFHNGKEALQAMEELKWRHLHDLPCRRPENSLENSIAKVHERVKEITAHYLEKFLDIADEDFVKTMVLDGCFILEYLIKVVVEDNPTLGTSKWHMLHLNNDLLLLENQIPFIVLEALFKAMAPPHFSFTAAPPGISPTKRSTALLLDLRDRRPRP